MAKISTMDPSKTKSGVYEGHTKELTSDDGSVTITETRKAIDLKAKVVGGDNGIPEAPMDGRQYGRQDGNWTGVPIPEPVPIATPAALGVIMVGMGLTISNNGVLRATQQLVADDGSGVIELLCVTGGDLVVRSLSGPNAGKSVNLTYGKWT